MPVWYWHYGESYFYVKFETTIQATNTAVTSLQMTWNIANFIANIGSDREAMGLHYYWEKLSPLPSTMAHGQACSGGIHKRKKSWQDSQNKNSSCHSGIMETKSPCIPLWTGDMQWVVRRAEGGFDLRRVNRGDRPGAQSPGEHAPQSHTCSTRHAASATFPFSFLPSFLPSLFLSYIILYLSLLPSASPTCICSLSHPIDPQGRGIKKWIWLVSHIAFYSNSVRAYRFHRLLRQYWEQSNKYSTFSYLAMWLLCVRLSKTLLLPENEPYIYIYHTSRRGGWWRGAEQKKMCDVIEKRSFQRQSKIFTRLQRQRDQTTDLPHKYGEQSNKC